MAVLCLAIPFKASATACSGSLASLELSFINPKPLPIVVIIEPASFQIALRNTFRISFKLLPTVFKSLAWSVM